MRRENILIQGCGQQSQGTPSKMACSDSRPVCKYGSACYRKNPQHLEQYSHPHLVNDEGNNIDLRKYKVSLCVVRVHLE